MSVDHYPLDYSILAHQPTEPGRPFCETPLPSDWLCGLPLRQSHLCPCGQWAAVRGSGETLWFPLAGPRGLVLEWSRQELDYGRYEQVTGHVFDRQTRSLVRRTVRVLAWASANHGLDVEVCRASLRRDLVCEYGEIEDAAGVETVGEYVRQTLPAPRVHGGRLWFVGVYNHAGDRVGASDVPVSDHGIKGAIPLPPEDPHGEPGPDLPWHEQNRRINALLRGEAP